MRNKHITRNYNANKVKVLRPDDDFRLEVFRYDKTSEQFYTVAKPNFDTTLATKYTLNGIPVYYTNKNIDLDLNFEYYAKTDSEHYRLELLYINTYKDTQNSKKNRKNKAIIKSIYVNGKQVLKNKEVKSNDVTYNRHYLYIKLKEGLNYIDYSLSSNMAFVGLAIKRFDVYEAHRDSRNSDKLTMIGNEVDKTSELEVNTMKCTLMYYHGLDEKLKPTDAKANPSGLLFDYRDEINYYVRNTTNKMMRVFGGYISKLDLDNDLTKLTLNCTDRLIDLDRRYCLSEIYLNGDTSDGKVTYNDSIDFVRNFKYYSSAIKFLMNHSEVPVNCNLIVDSPLVEMKRKTLANYGKKGYNKFTKNNIWTGAANNYVLLRNSNNIDKQQSIVIYDCSKKPQLLNNYPNLWIQYGMGKEVWEEKIYETKTKESSGIASSVQKQADKIAPNVTGWNAVKPIWEWITTHIKHNSKRKGFYQTPQTTLKNMEGNCCCKTELLLDMCNHKGVTDLKYVHVKKGSEGHVFSKINGKIIDPSISNGWGNYYKKLGKLGSGKTTTYPTKPF